MIDTVAATDHAADAPPLQLTSGFADVAASGTLLFDIGCHLGETPDRAARHRRLP
jgi:hypothetical protein